MLRTTRFIKSKTIAVLRYVFLRYVLDQIGIWISHRNWTCCPRIIWCWFIIWHETGPGSRVSNNELGHIVIDKWYAVSKYSLNKAFATRPTIFWHPIYRQSWWVSIFYAFYPFVIFFAFFRLLLTGIHSLPNVDNSIFENREMIEVLAGNLFDGDLGYNMLGFSDHVTVNIWSLSCSSSIFIHAVFHFSLKIYIHSPYETINVGKVSYYTNYSIEYHCFSNEVIVEKKFQK